MVIPLENHQHVVVVVVVDLLSCVRLCDPMDCSLSGSSIHGIFQGRVLEWIAISFSRDLPTLQADSLLSEPPGKPVTSLMTFEFTVSNTYLSIYLSIYIYTYTHIYGASQVVQEI